MRLRLFRSSASSIILLLVATACSSNDSRLTEAARWHESAMLKRAALGQVLDSLRQDGLAPQDSLARWGQELNTWDESLVEVPGHEHADHDHHSHDHQAHRPPAELSPEDVLAVQRELYTQLLQLEARVTRFTK